MTATDADQLLDELASLLRWVSTGPRYHRNVHGALVEVTWREAIVIGIAMGELGLWCQRVARYVPYRIVFDPTIPQTSGLGLCILHSCPLAVDECSDPAHLRVFRGPELRDLER